MGGKSKFQIQDSDLEYFSWRFEKHITLSETKVPLVEQSSEEKITKKNKLFSDRKSLIESYRVVEF